jgi:uncharacterized membrane protein (DUF373 family)
MTLSSVPAGAEVLSPGTNAATDSSSRRPHPTPSREGAPPGQQDQGQRPLSWYQQFRRVQIVQALEAVQDLIAVSLCMGLFCVMVLQLRSIFTSLLITKPQFHAITSDILFILILVELFRLLIIYLQEQRVSIGVSVEVAIVSVLREVIVSGVLETDWRQILAVCLFLATAALLLVVRVWLPPTFAGVDPEAQVSARARLSAEVD